MDFSIDALVDYFAVGCFFMVAVGCVYTLAAAWFVRQFGKAAALPAATSCPAVTILKPLKGLEPGLRANLARFCTQDYPGAVQIIFGVQDQHDPAIEAVDALRREFPNRDLELVVNSQSHGFNSKVSNLINMAAKIHHGVVVVSDSDIIVAPDYLQNVMAALDRPGVGAVTCLYRGVPTASVWARLQAAAIDYHFLPGALVGSNIGAARPCFGSTIALRTETLTAIGGFKAVVGQLADDYALGDLVHRAGLKVAIAPFVVSHVCAETSARDLFRHELRWLRTIRFIDWAGFAGSVVTYPLAFALIAGLLSGFDRLSFLAIFAALGSRFVLHSQVDATCHIRDNSFWIVPIRDVLSFVVFVASFFGNAVDWRKRRYSVRADGSLVHAGENVT